MIENSPVGFCTRRLGTKKSPGCALGASGYLLHHSPVPLLGRSAVVRSLVRSMRASVCSRGKPWPHSRCSLSRFFWQLILYVVAIEPSSYIAKWLIGQSPVTNAHLAVALAHQLFPHPAHSCSDDRGELQYCLLLQQSHHAVFWTTYFDKTILNF